DRGQGGGKYPERQPKGAPKQDRGGVSSRRPKDHPARLREVSQSRAEEPEDGGDSRGWGLNPRREESTGGNRAEPASNEPLERAAKRIARKPFQTFGEMVDSEQEQAQSTQERYHGGGIH